MKKTFVIPILLAIFVSGCSSMTQKTETKDKPKSLVSVKERGVNSDIQIATRAEISSDGKIYLK